MRYVMDEWLPPALRDSRWFMTPAFMIAYRTFNVQQFLDFKQNYPGWDAQQRADFYRSLNSISRNRPTDLNRSCLQRIRSLIPRQGCTVADFGCGGGFLLKELTRTHPGNGYYGFDFVRPRKMHEGISWHAFDLQEATVPPQRFDYVLCTHVLEHLLDYRAVMRRLVAAARERFIFVVPRQRPYRYTLDEHLHFFLFPEQLRRDTGAPGTDVELLDGDWLVTGPAPALTVPE